MRMCRRDVLRDTDMQAETIGEPLEPGDGLSGVRRGDLVFWKGHVAIMTDEKTMIHANGHTMLVSREGLEDAIERIGYLYGGPTGFGGRRSYPASRSTRFWQRLAALERVHLRAASARRDAPGRMSPRHAA